MTKNFDVVVLGAGNAGQAAAGAAKAAGKTVAIIESRDVGGVCPNRGCVPKKVLVAAAASLDHIQHASSHGITVGDPTLDWSALMERKQGFVAPLPDAMSSSLERRGIELFRGVAQFEDAHTVRVGDERLHGTDIVVATGSRPRPLAFPGAEHLSTSEDFLSMTELPKSVVFVGAGVIAFEFAHVLVRLGIDVTLLEVGPRPLGRVDADLVEQLVAHSRSLGITIHTSVSIDGIRGTDTGLDVSIVVDGSPQTLTADRVFNGAGRVPNVDNIGLENADVPLERGRPSVDAHLRSTSQPHIWFAGDSLPATPQLSPVATYEGRIVGHNLLHPEDLQSADYTTLPSAVFTLPTLATVGLTEAEANEQGRSFVVKTSDMKGWISSRTYAESAAWAKVLIDENTGFVLGAHLLGHGAGDVVHLFTLAMRNDIPATELATGLYAYPTFSNDLKFLV